MTNSLSIIISITLASAISGLLYRVGGASWGNKQFRRLGCPIISILLMIFLFKFKLTFQTWGIITISFGASCALITTYWDWITGKDNFYLHGAGIALAYLPFAIVTGDWLALILRTIVLGGAMGLWCKFFKKDYVEEIARGAFIQLSLLFYLI